MRLGFLTTLEQPTDCFLGGLLVTNHLGRPLEFQCTTPVKPNQTQKILYGPTLKPFVLSELIGKTLLERADLKPDLVLINDEELLGLRDHIDCPLAFVQSHERSRALVPAGAHASEEPGSLAMGQQALRVHHAHPSDSKAILERSHLIPEQANLEEPFERVCEALREVLMPGSPK